MDIHDMGQRSDAGNKYLLVVVDKATRFVFAYPMPRNSISQTLPSDPGIVQNPTYRATMAWVVC